MPVRKANAEWNGNLREGKGTVKTESGALDNRYSFTSRFEEGGKGTNPEELIGAAHAGCFSMALAGALAKDGYNPKSIKTEDKVHIEKVGDGFKITKIEMTTEAEIPGIQDDMFHKYAESAKQNCPVSQALKGVEMVLDARLVSVVGQ
ncbi:MAG: OsmC family protein [Ignavibacteria bacterium]|jgi:osmotically inducible protein OsmC|nr:OsmC family protein [Ignavibacteria bacterium]MCU7504198.1 OsmC family protein [Ignavibacteria bacterium]MCU7518123.1 OsmC family protein [Ignavibacteria bacterium]